MIHSRTMKKLISMLNSTQKAMFLDEYELYEPDLESIANTVCCLRTPSGKLSCAAFVGGNDHFYTLKASQHAHDDPFCSLNYSVLYHFLNTEFSFDQSQFETVCRYLEKHNCTFISLFENEENPVLLKAQLDLDFPFPNIKKPLENWLQALPSMVQCEVRFKNSRYFAQENMFYLNPLIRAAQIANKSIDCINLIVAESINDAQSLLPYDLDYGINTNQVVYIPVLRSNNVSILHTVILKEGIHFGSIDGGQPINYILVEGALQAGDSGAPAIIEKYGKIFYLGSVRSLDHDSRAIITIWGQAEEAALFSESGKDMIIKQGAFAKDIPFEYPLADYYPFGGPNKIPHIHSYNGGFHLKIRIDSQTKRIDIIKDGKFQEQKLRVIFSEMDDENSLVLQMDLKTKQALKDALLSEVKRYGFDYQEEPNDFDSVEEFRAFLNAKKISYKLI